MLSERTAAPDVTAAHGPRRPLLALWVCWSLAAAPVLLAMSLIVRYGVDLPRMDEVGVIGGLLAAMRKSGLSFSLLIAQANESRLVFPRLISVGLALLTRWDTRYEMWLTLALMLGNLAMMITLYRRQTRESSSSPLLLPLLVAGASVIIFSPFQTELVWGFQYLVHIPMTCLLASLLIGGSTLRPLLRHLLPLLLCVIATFSYANGMITWVLVPAFLAASGLFSGRRLAWCALWVTIAVACLWLYAHGYHGPRRHPSLLAFREQGWMTMVAFFSFLGAPLGFGAPGTPVSLFVPAAAGLTTVLATLLFLGRLLRSNQFRVALPWGILFGYAAASATITTLGRVGFGPHALLATRYAAFNTYAIAALFFMAALVWQFAPFTRPKRRVMQIACTLLVMAFLGLWVRSLGDNISAIRRLAQGSTRARAALPYYEQMPKVSGALEFFHPDLAKAVRYTRQARAAGLMRLAPVTQDHYDAALSHPRAGFVEQLAVDGDQASVGWASIPGQARPADAVVITRKSADTGRTPVGVCFPMNRRPDIAAVAGRKRGQGYGWTLKLPATSGQLLEAWAVDAATGTLYPLEFAQQVQR